MAEVSAAETRANAIAERATAAGHTVERARPEEDVFEVLVHGRHETVQVIVRQSKFPSRSSVWAQRIYEGRSRRIAASAIYTAIRSVTPKGNS